MKTFKRYEIYTATHKKIERDNVIWYDTEGNDMRFLHDLTNDEYVRIPWSDPTQRDLQAFIKGYCFGKGKQIDFEYTEMAL